MSSLSQAIVKRCEDCGLRPAFTDRLCALCYHEQQEVEARVEVEAKRWDAKRYPEREIGVVLDMDETFARPMGV